MPIRLTRLAWAPLAWRSAIFSACLSLSAGAAEARRYSGASEVVFIAQIVLLLLIGRLLGEAMQRIGQPAVIDQLVAGIILGPSVFGMITQPDTPNSAKSSVGSLCIRRPSGDRRRSRPTSG